MNLRCLLPRLVLTVFHLLLLAGCGTGGQKVNLSATGRYKAADYPRILERWTRDARIIKQLDTSLRVHATWVSPEFRGAYVARYSQMFALPAAKRKALAARLTKEWNDSYTFVFAASTHDFSWNDFHRKDSVWRISLANDRDEQVSALSVERTGRVTQTDIALYPYIGEFYYLYRVRFPRALADGRPLISPGTRKVALRFAGPLGSTELVWQLE